MRTLTAALLAAALAVPTAAAQDPKLHTHPTVPPREALDRLHLQLGWHAYIPMDGRRDGLARVGVIGRDVGVQTRSGLLALLDAETGQTRWQVRLGNPYRATLEVGWNSSLVFVVNQQTLYALDRKTGQLQWEYDIGAGVTAAPVADEDQIFLSVGEGTVIALGLAVPGAAQLPPPVAAGGPSPDRQTPSGYGGSGTPAAIGPLTSRAARTPVAIGPLSSARQAGRSLAVGIQPRFDWKISANVLVEHRPLQTGGTVFIPGGRGKVVGLVKGIVPGQRYNYVLADGPVIVPAGQHGEEAYVPSQDSNLYAVDIESGRTRWRFTTGTPVAYRPGVTDDDVFIATGRGVLRRLERVTGREVWQNADAARFLAANPKFVYAADRAGRLLVLDRANGRTLGSYDARDFVVPVSNDFTDRVFLAANDGQLVCLHDGDYRTPLAMKKVPELRRRFVEEKGGKGADKPKPAPKEKEKPADDGPGEKEKKPKE